MAAIVYKKVIRIFMVLCLLMQALAVVPHHHHGGSEAPCLNIVHCLESECEAEVICDRESHEHRHSHGAQEGRCSFDDRELFRIDREDTRLNLLSNSNLLFCTVFTVGSDEDPCGHCRFDRILELSIRQNRGVPGLYTAYIATALQPRAPSFTV